MNRRVFLPHWPPRRIISLVPSQTELLADLGLDEAVVGITKFCVHPPSWFQSKLRAGGTKTINFQKVDALSPDLIIGNKEENTQEQIEWLARKYPVWMSDVYSLADALDMLRRIGDLTGKTAAAAAIAREIETGFGQLEQGRGKRLPTAAYLIWRKPYMVAAAHTFVHDMLQHAGFANAFGHLARYPEVSPEQLAAANPDLLLLSSEPYPFAEKHFAALRELCPDAQIQLVDGEMFSWYGSRLRHAPAYFGRLRQGLGL